MKFVAIDPGDLHVGWAEFERFGEHGEWRCFNAEEITPEQTLERLWRARPGTWSAFVVEGFWLQPAEAPKLVGSELLTSQLIGAIRWVGVVKNTRVAIQSNQVKKPTRALLRRRAIARVAPATPGNHARDAELHGWHYIWRGNR